MWTWLIGSYTCRNSMRVWLWCYLMSPRVIHSWPTFGEQNSLHVEWLWLHSAKENKNTETVQIKKTQSLKQCINKRWASVNASSPTRWQICFHENTLAAYNWGWNLKKYRLAGTSRGLELLEKTQTSQIVHYVWAAFTCKISYKICHQHASIKKTQYHEAKCKRQPRK